MTLDSSFSDHGLDSLDVIELVIQVEDELGYLIDAEKLELFSKPKHFVNFIIQMEAYKAEHNRLPHENIHAESLLKSLFPGIPYLTKWAAVLERSWIKNHSLKQYLNFLYE